VGVLLGHQYFLVGLTKRKSRLSPICMTGDDSTALRKALTEAGFLSFHGKWQIVSK
jgi:hypothetical protein